MSLLRVTAHDNHPLALTPSDILTIETASSKHRKELLGSNANSDAKTMIRLALDGRVVRVWLRNPPRKLAARLKSMGVVKAWWEGRLAERGACFARPSTIVLMEGVPEADRAKADYDGANSIVTARLMGESAVWRCANDFDRMLSAYEDLIAEERGVIREQEPDDVGGLDDDEGDDLDDEGDAPAPARAA